jgi:hypothetical protein
LSNTKAWRTTLNCENLFLYPKTKEEECRLQEILENSTHIEKALILAKISRINPVAKI